MELISVSSENTPAKNKILESLGDMKVPLDTIASSLSSLRF